MINKINDLIKENQTKKSKIITNIQIKNNQIIKYSNTNSRREIVMFVYSKNDFFKREDLNNIENDDAGIYFLINERDNSIYIGKTDDIFRRRLNCHIEANKEFNKVFLFYASKEYNWKWSPSITSFLESWFINFFSETKIFNLLNHKNEQFKNWDVHDEDTLEIAFESLIPLCLNEGIDLNAEKNKFNVVKDSKQKSQKEEKICVYLDDIKAEYYFNRSRNKSLKLFKNTIVYKRDFNPNKYQNSLKVLNNYNNWFENNIKNGNLLEIDINVYKIENDFFSSPSITAAVISSTISCNGKEAWKTSDNQSLNKILKNRG